MGSTALKLRGEGVQIAVANVTATLAVHTQMPMTVEFFCNMTPCLSVKCFLLFLGCYILRMRAAPFSETSVIFTNVRGITSLLTCFSSSPESCRPALRLTQPPVQWLPRLLPEG